MPADSTAVPSSSAAGKLSDPTFRRYTDDQAKVYAAQRLSYPSELYEAILAHHSATGGQLGLLVDVGCGPGNATRDVARSFDRAIGVDPGEAMIATARGLGGKTRAGEDIVFEAGAAEELLGVPGVEEGGVDLVTAAMAVGWTLSSASCSLVLLSDIVSLLCVVWKNVPLIENASLLCRRTGSIWISSGGRPRRS